jgi:hypothetical protein
MKIIDILKFYSKEDTTKLYSKVQLPRIYELLSSLNKFKLLDNVEYKAYFDASGWIYGFKDNHQYDIAYLDLQEILSMQVIETQLFDTVQLFKHTINWILENFNLKEELNNNYV